MEDFLNILERHEITVLVDVRSNPFTKYSAHFNQVPLRNSMQQAGLKYLFLGRELGGKPNDESFYDDEGYLRYDRVADSPMFKTGLSRVLSGIENYSIALMCGEENPTGCHRRLLIARVLLDHGVSVSHIRSGGNIQSESDLVRDEERSDGGAQQLTLFSESLVEKPWRSAKPAVARRI
ncbi:MAG: DUF488 domain-containing protein [Leptolyngbya sp.]|nr:DUF488 domain-containing protein [Candidatus Melainabacteria bacterium]